MKKLFRSLFIVMFLVLIAAGCGEKKEDTSKPNEKKETKEDIEKRISDDAKNYINGKYDLNLSVVSIKEVIFEENIAGASPTGDYKIVFSDDTVVFYQGNTKDFSDNMQVKEILAAINSEIINPLLRDSGFVEKDEKDLFYVYGARNNYFYDGASYFVEKYDSNIKNYLEKSNVTIAFHDDGIKMMHLVTSSKALAKNKISNFMETLGKYFDSWGNRVLVVAIPDVTDVDNIITNKIEENEKVLVGYYFEGRDNPYEMFER